MKVLFSGFRYSGHSKYGGYDWIHNFPDADYISDEQCFFNFIPSGVKGKVLNLYFLDKKTRKIAKNYDIVHCFYGDYTVFSTFPRNRKYKAIATIHQNVELSIPHHKNIMKCLKSLDGIVCLSSQQAKDLREKYGFNTIFIPHGFNKPIFNHINVKKVCEDFSEDNINIVCVGRQYRDYETLLNVVYNTKDHTNIKFHFIGGDPIVKERLANYNNVRIYGRLTDNEYYTLISECDWNFLPLSYATANNALMESAYLGIRSILPMISGVTDYACPYENFFYKTTEEAINFFMNIKKNKPSEVISSYAQNFSWSNIYKQLEIFYKSVLE